VRQAGQQIAQDGEAAPGRAYDDEVEASSIHDG
jgi:hypothetical protein